MMTIDRSHRARFAEAWFAGDAAARNVKTLLVAVGGLALELGVAQGVSALHDARLLPSMWVTLGGLALGWLVVPFVAGLLAPQRWAVAFVLAGAFAPFLWNLWTDPESQRFIFYDTRPFLYLLLFVSPRLTTMALAFALGRGLR